MAALIPAAVTVGSCGQEITSSVGGADILFFVCTTKLTSSVSAKLTKHAYMANDTPLIAQSAAAKPKRRRWRLLWTTLLFLVAAVGLWGGLRAFSRTRRSRRERPRSLPEESVRWARGPRGEVVSIAPPIQTGALAGARVEKLLVDVGDENKSRNRSSRFLTPIGVGPRVIEAKAKVEVAKAKLAQVNYGRNLRSRAQEARFVVRKLTSSEPRRTSNERSPCPSTKAIAREEYAPPFEIRAGTSNSRTEPKHNWKRSRRSARWTSSSRGRCRSSRGYFDGVIRGFAKYEVRSPFWGQVLRIRARPGDGRGLRDHLNLATQR